MCDTLPAPSVWVYLFMQPHTHILPQGTPSWLRQTGWQFLVDRLHRFGWWADILPRDAYYETGDAARLPAQLVAGWWEQMKWTIEYEWQKLYFGLGRLEKPRQDKILLYRKNNPSDPTKEGHLSYVPSLHLPQFEPSAGATPLLSLWFCPSTFWGHLNTSTPMYFYIAYKKQCTQ